MGKERAAETVGDAVSAFRNWLQTHGDLGDITVLSPAKASSFDGIALVVQRLEHGERRHSDMGDPVIEAILLVLVAGSDPLFAATLGGELLFALHDERWTDDAGEARSLRVEAGGDADAVRASLGFPPMLALLVRLPVERRRRRISVRPVLHPMRTHIADLSVLEGVVLCELKGSKARPLAEARIEAVDYGKSDVSDHIGRFRIAGLPADGAISLAITARQRVHAVSTNARSGVVLTMPIATDEESPEGQ